MRAAAIREIIASLKLRTGRDFGDDPATWIQELNMLQRTGKKATVEPESRN
jgi:hypothetical protein